MAPLQELDSLEITVIVDNELDPISPCPNPAVQQSGGMKDIAFAGPALEDERGGNARELRMDHICCSAHGLSLLITAVKGAVRRTLLFDAGPEAHVWQRNATRLRADISTVELIHLSHWHRDHSGGMLKALEMINKVKTHGHPVTVDLHPDRPDFRGLMAMAPVSLEADPTFDELAGAGGKVEMHDKTHNVLDGMFLVSGEIPRAVTYEQGIKRGIRFDKAKQQWKSDELIMDERFVMCKIKGKGLVMFTGCSHAGVVNASKHALSLGEGTPLYAVMGGFHLADAEPETIGSSVRDLKALDPKLLLAGHCTGWRAKFAIEKEMPGCLVPSFVGSKFVL